MTEGPHGRLTDNSLEALAAWRRREDAWLAKSCACGKKRSMSSGRTSTCERSTTGYSKMGQ